MRRQRPRRQVLVGRHALLRNSRTRREERVRRDRVQIRAVGPSHGVQAVRLTDVLIQPLPGPGKRVGDVRAHRRAERRHLVPRESSFSQRLALRYSKPAHAPRERQASPSVRQARLDAPSRPQRRKGPPIKFARARVHHSIYRRLRVVVQAEGNAVALEHHNFQTLHGALVQPARVAVANGPIERGHGVRAGAPEGAPPLRRRRVEAID